MSKKKHQGEPNAGDSTDSCDENQNMAECVHISKSVDLQRLKKTLIRTKFLKDCELCKNLPPLEEELSGWEFDLSLWMCLKCGNQACGRSRNKHALLHYETPHSDKHSMCVNTTMWSVWCYECNDEVNVTCKKKLLETVEYLKKHAESTAVETTDQVSEITSLLSTSSTALVNRMELPLAISNSLPRARGLTNLGNTCFFNSVMQCLGQTPYLLDLLREASKSEQYFKLPGGTITSADKSNTIVAPPLEGKLEKWKSLMETLAETLRELQSGRAEVFTPRHLFSRLSSRMPQFGGGDQHDSHELLRHLLEAVREEDLRRYQAVILDHKGLRKTNPVTVDECTKRLSKFYSQQAESLLATEQVFRGVLVSTLQCKECDHTSHRDEYFLDLSLPIAKKQVPPALRRKVEELEDNKLTKHQIKKEKRAERKKNKKQKSHKILTGVGSNMSVGDIAMDKSDSESDADVEDNAEENSSAVISTQPMVVGDGFAKGTESGYNSDKLYNSSPDSNNRDRSPSDSGVPSPTSGVLCVLLASRDNSPTSSEANVDMGSPAGDRNALVCDGKGLIETFERPESRLAFANKSDIKNDLEKLSLLNDGNSTKAAQKAARLMEEDNACANVEDEQMDEDLEDEEDDEDDDDWTSTLAPRYQCEEAECSVQSCLNQFTTLELMNGNNKVGCEICTKRHGGSEKKTVYTNTTKQLLIYNPPAVLILHLKRFQVCRFRSAKVPEFVNFPTLLDLAPFCSRRSMNLPTFEEGQTRVLYSLYGVVEHSGSIHGGHYVSYVKVRPPLEPDSYRWSFLPKNNVQKGTTIDKGATANPEPPPGKWYYISDSYVTEVGEAKVLTAQAYLLFYERIL